MWFFTKGYNVLIGVNPESVHCENSILFCLPGVVTICSVLSTYSYTRQCLIICRFGQNFSRPLDHLDINLCCKCSTFMLRNPCSTLSTVSFLHAHIDTLLARTTGEHFTSSILSEVLSVLAQNPIIIRIGNVFSNLCGYSLGSTYRSSQNA